MVRQIHANGKQGLFVFIRVHTWLELFHITALSSFQGFPWLSATA